MPKNVRFVKCAAVFRNVGKVTKPNGDRSQINIDLPKAQSISEIPAEQMSGDRRKTYIG